ncbi:LutC/YkgG family protein [Salirhabdus salicampi]|uniref:LutC/YkgG family protein n=1 Tax=Salirhabdus salicampi TaxID=476102 RepID=UPI0020C265A7|nr:lactate utilization protein C [Salirhabdus salicampi]
MVPGSIQNKDEFLDDIASTLGRERKRKVEKPKWSYRPQWNVYDGYSQDQLVQVLKEQCTKIHTNVEETTVTNLKDCLRRVIEQYGEDTVVTWDDPRFEEFNIKNYLHEEAKAHVWKAELGEENVKTAEKANIGITFSDITLAESGTVALFSDKGKGRSVSLLPSTYVAIIPKSTIVPRMTQAASMIEREVAEGNAVASCVNFISGPSNSADIEMNLIVGVHGPIHVTYIIVHDK